MIVGLAPDAKDIYLEATRFDGTSVIQPADLMPRYSEVDLYLLEQSCRLVTTYSPDLVKGLKTFEGEKSYPFERPALDSRQLADRFFAAFAWIRSSTVTDNNSVTKNAAPTSLVSLGGMAFILSEYKEWLKRPGRERDHLMDFVASNSYATMPHEGKLIDYFSPFYEVFVHPDEIMCLNQLVAHAFRGAENIYMTINQDDGVIGPIVLNRPFIISYTDGISRMRFYYDTDRQKFKCIYEPISRYADKNSEKIEVAKYGLMYRMTSALGIGVRRI